MRFPKPKSIMTCTPIHMPYRLEGVHACGLEPDTLLLASVSCAAGGSWVVGTCGWGVLSCIHPCPCMARTKGVLSPEQPDESAEGLEGEECGWKHAAAAAPSAGHGSQIGRWPRLERGNVAL